MRVVYKTIDLIVVAKNHPQAKSKAVKNLANRRFTGLVDHEKSLVERL